MSEGRTPPEGPTLTRSPQNDSAKGIVSMNEDSDNQSRNEDLSLFGIDDNNTSDPVPAPPAEDTPIEIDEDQTGTGERSRDGRERFNIRNKARVSRWLRDEMGTGPLSGLFLRDGELVYTPRVNEAGYVPREDDEGDDGPAQIRPVTEGHLKAMVEIKYDLGVGTQFEQVAVNDAGEEIVTGRRRVWETRMLPRECAAHGINAAQLGDCPNLRVLAGVTHTPIMRADGSVLDVPGYDPATKMMYLPDPGLTVPPVPEEPTPGEIKDAVELIASMISEFPFVEEHHRANWLGALFTPIVRPMYPSPYPLFMIDAPAPGSGKSYLASIIRTVHGGIIRAGFDSDDKELKKSLLGVLTGTTAPVVTFDNVRGKIKSAVFEMLLTARTFSARQLGQTREMSAPNDRLWVMTGNNAEIDGDLARRTYWVTIDPNMPRPFERTGFRLDLNTWVPENRGRLVAALLTIVRGWIVAGRPAATAKRSDDYTTWDSAMEGLLTWAGFAGQFGRPDPKHMDANEDQEWMTFLYEVERVMGVGRWFKMSDLVKEIVTPDGFSSPFEDGNSEKIDPNKLPGDLPDKWGGRSTKAGFTKTIGRWFAHRSGRYVGDLVVRMSKDNKNGSSYMLEKYGPAPR